ncbi:hypothetical protein DL93DRAFT_2073508 [Clavulina sp. PMI_390]|nr:hypothetical protein DL93DRAFT_2073508 [Clavulina sp. PMI_390]
MDYLRSIGSAVLAKSGVTHPFILGNKVIYFEGRGIWTLYEATKRDDSSPVSVFHFDGSNPSRKNLLPLAKNALRKLRTIRHPDVLKFIDVVETETSIHIVTERVQPLGIAISAWSSKPAAAREEWLVWGLQRVAIALSFVNDSCQSTHGNLRTDSIFISPSGEWRLGGFELLSNPKEDNAVLYSLGSLMPDLTQYTPPEVKAAGWSSAKENDVSAPDAYEFGLLIHSVFNPNHPLPPTSLPPHPAPTASSRGAIPTTIFPSFKRLLMPKPKPRLTSKGFLEIGNGEKTGEGAGFFSQNRLVKICASLEGFNLSSESDKATFLRTLKESADSFPSEFLAHKVLPTLVNALEFGGASAGSMLPLVFLLGHSVPPSDYATVVLGPVVKLFASPDRGTRMALLDHLPEYADKLDQRTVSDKIWPHLQTGFGDTVAVIREATVRSVSVLSSKLTDRILNNELLKHLAKSQLDTEASIRTNTCILIGRLAPNLSATTQRKVLIPAFSRALKDAFVHARVAGLMALMATIQLYEAEELATKVIPSMSFTLVDKEKLVRDQSSKAMDLFIKKIEAHAQMMPETAIPPAANGEAPAPYAASNSTQAALVNSAAGAAGALAGWAMSSLGRTLATSDLQTQIAELPSRPQPNPTNGTTSTLSAPAVPVSTRPSTSTTSKGMQLGASKQPLSKGGSSSLAAELEREAAAEMGGGSDAWAESGDLMDVNADAGDWTDFQTGPSAVEMETAWEESLDQESLEPSPAVSRAISPKPVSTTSSAIRTSAVSSPKPLFSGLAPASPPSKPIVVQRAAAIGAANPPPPVAPVVIPPQAKAPAPASSVPGGWDNDFDDEAPPATPSAAAPTGSMAGMSKDEKAAEMARRREERKQRIAALKEQKKTGGK